MSDLSVTLPKVLALSLFQRFMLKREDFEEGTIDICCALCILYIREKEYGKSCQYCPMYKFIDLREIAADPCTKWVKAIEPSFHTAFHARDDAMHRLTDTEEAAAVLAKFASEATALITWIDESGVKLDKHDALKEYTFKHDDVESDKILAKKLLTVQTCKDMKQKAPEIGYQWDAGTILSPHLSGRFFAELTERGWSVNFYIFKRVDTYCFACFDNKGELPERRAKLYARELTDFANTLCWDTESQVTS